MSYARSPSDGSRLSAMAYERNYEQTIYAVDGNPANAGGAKVELRPLRTLRNPPARWCALSSDRASLACNTATAPEDLVVLRADGSEMRRLTSDLHKDRTPLWDTTGRRLSFYSTRSGALGVLVDRRRRLRLPPADGNRRLLGRLMDAWRPGLLSSSSSRRWPCSAWIRSVSRPPRRRAPFRLPRRASGSRRIRGRMPAIGWPGL